MISLEMLVVTIRGTTGHSGSPKVSVRDRRNETKRSFFHYFYLPKYLGFTLHSKK